METANVNNKNLPAFASVAISGNDGYQQDGLSKREYFAAMALSGIMANPNCTPSRQEHFDNIAIDAMNVADATLRFLNEP